jgi:hypothetical protein
MFVADSAGALGKVNHFERKGEVCIYREVYLAGGRVMY